MINCHHTDYVIYKGDVVAFLDAFHPLYWCRVIVKFVVIKSSCPEVVCKKGVGKKLAKEETSTQIFSCGFFRKVPPVAASGWYFLLHNKSLKTLAIKV